MTRLRRILIIMQHNGYSRDVIRGIDAYCSTHGAWEYHFEEDSGADLVARSRIAISQWKAGGIIAMVTGPHIERFIIESGLPAINYGGYFKTKLPTVMNDNRAIGRLVARHFLDNGCRSFAFCARTGELTPQQRCAGFVAEVRKAGFNCNVLNDRFEGEREKNWVNNRRRMDAWLRSLPKPVAIMCAHDKRGQELSWACRRAGLRVPDEVALVSVGDDELLCRMCTPPLSSVNRDAQRIGYEAVRLLHRMLRGKRAPAHPVLIPPRGLSARQSSDIIAIADPDVATAMRFIRDHARQSVSVKELLADIPISRRSLERRFERVIGRTPKAEIMRTRMTRAKELLAETDLPMSMIAEKLGFQAQEKFSAAFRRECNQTPSAFRRESRLAIRASS